MTYMSDKKLNEEIAKRKAEHKNYLHENEIVIPDALHQPAKPLMPDGPISMKALKTMLGLESIFDFSYVDPKELKCLDRIRYNIDGPKKRAGQKHSPTFLTLLTQAIRKQGGFFYSDRANPEKIKKNLAKVSKGEQIEEVDLNAGTDAENEGKPAPVPTKKVEDVPASPSKKTDTTEQPKTPENTMTKKDIKNLKKEYNLNLKKHPYLGTELTIEHTSEKALAGLHEAGITTFFDLIDHTTAELSKNIASMGPKKVEKMMAIIKPMGAITADDLDNMNAVALQIEAGDKYYAENIQESEIESEQSEENNLKLTSDLKKADRENKQGWSFVKNIALDHQTTLGDVAVQSGLDVSIFSPSKEIARSGIHRRISVMSIVKVATAYGIPVEGLPKSYQKELAENPELLKILQPKKAATAKKSGASALKGTKKAAETHDDEQTVYHKMKEILGNKIEMFYVEVRTLDPKSALAKYATTKYDLVGEVALKSRDELKEEGVTTRQINAIEQDMTGIGLRLGLYAEAKEILAQEKKIQEDEKIQQTVNFYKKKFGHDA